MAVSSSDLTQSLDFVAKAGDSFSRSIAVKNPNTSNYDFTNHTARMQVKEGAFFTTSVLELTSSSGITLSTGSLVIDVSPEDMQIKPGVYVYDVEITLPSGSVQTWYGGTFTINGDVTR